MNRTSEPKKSFVFKRNAKRSAKDRRSDFGPRVYMGGERGFFRQKNMSIFLDTKANNVNKRFNERKRNDLDKEKLLEIDPELIH